MGIFHGANNSRHLRIGRWLVLTYRGHGLMGFQRQRGFWTAGVVGAIQLFDASGHLRTS